MKRCYYDVLVSTSWWVLSTLKWKLKLNTFLTYGKRHEKVVKEGVKYFVNTYKEFSCIRKYCCCVKKMYIFWFAINGIRNYYNGIQKDKRKIYTYYIGQHKIMKKCQGVSEKILQNLKNFNKFKNVYKCVEL